MDSVLYDTNQRIQKALDHLRLELSSIRAGRANPTLVENIPVEAYGSKMRLVEVGTISAPQPALLTVQVWDMSLVENVVRALQEANLGLNSSFEGNVIRIPIPPLTEERREEFIKLVHSKMEESKISIRQIRQDTKESWERQLKDGEFGEDEYQRRIKLLQGLVDKSQNLVEQLGKNKVEELSQI